MVSYLRDLPYPGVTFVVAEAASKGFKAGDPSWINLGQGQPETGQLPGGPERISSVTLDPSDYPYGPVNGSLPLRQAVADTYNRHYRTDKKPYRAENVAIVQGGRLALNRVLGALGDIKLGYRLPDYAAYEELINWQMPRGVTPVQVELSDLSGVDALLLSNPCNPTGEVLRSLVKGPALLVDEFYSHYVYDGEAPVSAASQVDDPDTDDVVICDGVTKNLRYPGWRVAWIVGPTHLISAVDRVGSALDGGSSLVAQRAALTALEPSYMDAETLAVRKEFRRKRDLMVSALRDMGFDIATPSGTFYVWGRMEGDASEFFYRALEERVITVPGHVFDINPGKHRPSRAYQSHVRFSFGPPYAVVEEGLTRLAKLF